MADHPLGQATFWTQADTLLRKNLTYQKRNMMTNVRLILFPLVLCIMLVLMQSIIDSELDKPKYGCGCTCIDTNGDGRCEEVCGVQFSTLEQASSCPIPSPPEWPPLLQMPAHEFRAVRTDFNPFTDLPDESCRRTGSCPATVLVTGTNKSLGEIVLGSMFTNSFNLNSKNISDSLASNVLGSRSMTENDNFLEPAFASNLPLYNVQLKCTRNSSLTVFVPVL